MKPSEDEHSRTYRAQRVHDLLKTYAPDLVEVLDQHQLMVMVATRLGEAFCTKSGLNLESCGKLWVPFLAF